MRGACRWKHQPGTAAAGGARTHAARCPGLPARPRDPRPLQGHPAAAPIDSGRQRLEQSAEERRGRVHRRPAGATQHRRAYARAPTRTRPEPPQPEALHAHLDLKAMAASTTAATCLSRSKHCAMPAVAPKGPRLHGPAGLHVRRQHPVGHTSQQLLDRPHRTAKQLRLANRTRRGEAALRKVQWAWASSP